MYPCPSKVAKVGKGPQAIKMDSLYITVMFDQTLEDDTHTDDKLFSRWVWLKEDKNMDLQVKQDRVTELNPFH